MSAPFSPLHQEKKNCILKYNYLTVGLTISLAGNLPDPAQPALYSPNYCLHHPSLTRQAILPLISAWKRNRAGRSGNESFSQIGAWVHSSLPVRPASQERLGPRCVGGDAFETEWSHTACLPPRKHMKEGCVCLAVRKREKGLWQLSRGWLAVKCDLFLAPSTSSYLKTRYWGSVWERGGSGGGGTTTAEKCCLFSANTVFPGVVLQRHRGTSLCLCFVSVISVPFSIITWQLIPPGAGFWLFNLSLWIRYWLSGPPRGPAEHLNRSIPPHLTWPGPTQSSLGWLLPSLHP